MNAYLNALRDGPPWFSRLLVAVAAFNFSFGVLWVAYNLYISSLGYGESLAGYAAAAASVAALLFALPVGRLTDKWGAGPVLLVGLSLMGVGIALRGLAMVPFSIIALSFVSGALWEPLRHVVNPLLAVGEDKSANRRFAFSFAWGSLFTALGTWGGGHLPSLLSAWGRHLPGGEITGGYQATFLLAAIVPPLAAFSSAPLWHVHHGRGEKKAPSRTTLRDLVRRNGWAVGKFWLTMLPLALGAGLSIPFMNLYLKDRHGFGDASVGNAFSIQQVVLVFAFFLGPWIASRFSTVKGVVFLETLSLPFLLALAYTGSPELAVVAFVARGALMNASAPLGTRILMTLTPPGARGISSAMVGVIWGLGFAVGPAVGGGWIERSGYVGPFVMTASLYFVSIVLFWAFFRNLRMSEETPPA